MEIIITTQNHNKIIEVSISIKIDRNQINSFNTKKNTELYSYNEDKFSHNQLPPTYKKNEVNKYSNGETNSRSRPIKRA